MWQLSLTFFTVFDRELVHSYLLHTLSLVCDSLFYMTDCLLWRTVLRLESLLHHGLSFVTDSFCLQSALNHGLSFITDIFCFHHRYTFWASLLFRPSFPDVHRFFIKFLGPDDTLATVKAVYGTKKSKFIFQEYADGKKTTKAKSTPSPYPFSTGDEFGLIAEITNQKLKVSRVTYRIQLCLHLKRSRCFYSSV